MRHFGNHKNIITGLVKQLYFMYEIWIRISVKIEKANNVSYS